MHKTKFELMSLDQLNSFFMKKTTKDLLISILCRLRSLNQKLPYIERRWRACESFKVDMDRLILEFDGFYELARLFMDDGCDVEK